MYRLPAGVFNTSCKQDFALFRTRFLKFWLILFFVCLIVFPFIVDAYLVSIANLIGVSIIGAIGLNILTGFAG